MFSVSKQIIQVALFIVIVGSLGISCSKQKTRSSEGVLDNPVHHVQRGKELLAQERWDAARREFRLALELKPDYSPALAGQALVRARDSKLPGKSKRERTLAAEESAELLDKAFDAADSDKQKHHANVMAIRIATLTQSSDWIEDAEDAFENAVELQEDNIKLQRRRAEPYFYMAQAYQENLQLEKAVKRFKKVLSLNLSYTKEANEALELLNKIIRAQPGTRHGKAIAMVKKLTRADMAALLVAELDLPGLYFRLKQTSRSNAYQSPTRKFTPPAERKREVPAASDIADHPLSADIEEVLTLKVRGLEASPQHLFYPNQPITRSEYAVMLEDILIKVTQDNTLATRFIGESSPWVDVREDAFYYNAARTLVSRDIMTVWNKVRAEFGPSQTVHGADALLGIRTLKDELNSYVK